MTVKEFFEKRQRIEQKYLDSLKRLHRIHDEASWPDGVDQHYRIETDLRSRISTVDLVNSRLITQLENL